MPGFCLRGAYTYHRAIALPNVGVFSINTILQGPAQDQLKTIDSDSIDLIVTDPPYGYSFMNKDWDKAVVGVDTWKECLRVLKPGAFAFIMSSPRQDVLCKMILNLIDAGFETNFTSLYWTYASGFPKAADVSKLVDKKAGLNLSSFREIIKKRRIEMGLTRHQLAAYFPSKTGGITGCVHNWEGLASLPTIEQYNKLVEILKLDKEQYPELEEAEREIIATSNNGAKSIYGIGLETNKLDITKPATPQAKRLEGSYAGFQPKPAVELILVVMKPLSEKTFVDQALSNGKGCTWLDDCRIPYQSEQDRESVNNINSLNEKNIFGNNDYAADKTSLGMIRHVDINDKGRFPANLLVEDDVLNDGKITKSRPNTNQKQDIRNNNFHSLSDKSKKIDRWEHYPYNDEGSFSRYFSLDSWTEKTLPFLIVPKAAKAEKGNACTHPTVKPLKLMSYLITMGSREGDIVLDPFCGSGTVLIAARQLARDFIGIEISPEYVQIANTRLKPYIAQTRLPL